MLSIELSFITGIMLGIEFITKEDTGGEMSAVVIDLLIVRIGFYCYAEEE